MNNIQIYHKLEQLEKMVTAIQEERLADFRAIDYRDYIRQPLENFTKAWKYNGVYYKSPGSLYDLIVNKEGYTKTKNTFRRLLENPNRQLEMWNLRIQLIYVSQMQSGRWMTCEGKLLTANSFSLIRGNPNNNKIRLMNDGESYVVSRSFGTYKTFIDPTVKPTQKFLFLDGFYGNCAVDNLAIADKDKATKGLWE